MDYQLMKAETREHKLFFRLDGEDAERHGTIGYLRGDYGKNGKEFWTTWFNNQAHLKTPAFKQEFDKVINWLREASQADYQYDGTFAEQCLLNMRQPVTDTAARFKIQTENYTYYVRCRPRQGDYDFYCFAYDNAYLLPELAGQHELPNDCYSILPSTGELIFIVYGEKGYYPMAKSTPDRDINRQIATANNALQHITRAQEEAMFAGSMFGWSSPAAKPWKYEIDGTPRPSHQPKNKEYDR